MHKVEEVVNRAVSACRRCREKDIRCEYPHVDLLAVLDVSSAISNHISLVPEGDDESLTNDIGGVNIMSLLDENGAANYESLLLTSPCIGSYIAQSPAALLPSIKLPLAPLTDFDVYWFLSPGTWNIAQSSLQTGSPAHCYDNESITFVVKQKTGKWLRQWVSEGRTPFIHRKLYGNEHGMSRCIQDAYTTVESYFQRGSDIEDIAMQILNERVSQLIRDCGDESQNTSPQQEPDNGGKWNNISRFADSSLDTGQSIFSSFARVVHKPHTWYHLARVQPLLMYQPTRPFDGNL